MEMNDLEEDGFEGKLENRRGRVKLGFFIALQKLLVLKFT